MSLLIHARGMARYNQWMNERIYDACAGLSDAERKRDAGAFFRSIHGTLNHILLADRLWMGRFTDEPYTVQSLDQELYADFDTLRSERAREDERIRAWAETLTEETLGGELTYTSAVNPEPRRMPYWLAVSHFFNHQTHHRGQITALLTQQGVDPGVTDFIWCPEAKEFGAAGASPG